MKNLISLPFLLIILFLATVSNSDDKKNQNGLSGFESNIKETPTQNHLLTPCCNNFDPKVTSGQNWSLLCYNSEILIDSLCCVDLWNWYHGAPPSSMPCSSVSLRCPAEFH